MASITPMLWTRTGNDYVRDGLTGRLGSPKEFGDTLIAGAINSNAIKKLGDDQTVFYAGSVNGGLYSRLYNEKTDTWSKEWTWESKPGSGYDGGQSIGAIALSEDGKLLAVGRGNPSNYNALGTTPYGIQIARVKNDGSLAWLETKSSIREKIQDLPIRALAWSDQSLIATTPDAALELSVENGTIKQVATALLLPSLFTADQMPDNSIAIAGYDYDQFSNSIILRRDGQNIPLRGKIYEDYIQSVNENGSRISRISAYPEPINGEGVFFVGSFTPNQENSGWISRIDRISIDLGGGTVKEITSAPIEYGLIGSNQAGNQFFYGNFSFAADPFDPKGRSVFAGGNTFGSSPGSQALSYSGGLVRIRLKADSQGKRDTIENVSYLYGPRLKNNKNVLLPPAPGQPHADSRSISFYHGQDGAKLIQTDDGGIWSIDLQLSTQGAKPKKGAWWMPLTPDHNGFQGLEVNMVDWGSNANIIATSYQDNAASLGYFGDENATNLWAGDGEVAIIDDGGTNNTSPTSYLSLQKYIAGGSMSKYSYDAEGFLRGMQPVYFTLRKEDGSIVPWSQTPEVAYYNLNDPDNSKRVPFLAPIEENPYAANNIIMAGSVNAYETIESGINYLVFRPLLKEDQTTGITFTALDNTSELVNNEDIGSVYLAGISPEGQVMIYGRQKKIVPGEDPQADSHLSPIEFNNLSEGQLSDLGTIIDISHRPTGSGQDLLYILQGGMSLLTLSGVQPSPGQGTSQYLQIGSANGSVKTFTLEELGLPILAGDVGYQSSVYIPANDHHGDKLVIGGLAGVWISDVDEEGMPIGFKAMNWEGLDQGIAPGSYVRTIKYEPQDDLLILGTQGQGNWLYSFSGDLGKRPHATKLLHMSDTSLVQGTRPDLDKRGNQFNQTITIQLDSRLQDKREATDVEIILHNKGKWRHYMSMVSPYNVSEDGNINKHSSAREQADRWYSILKPFGLHYRGGRETKNSIIMPFSFEPGISMFNLAINAKDFYHSDPAKLRYSVRTTDGNESVTRTLSLIGQPEPGSSSSSSSALQAADTPDEIIHYTKAQRHQATFESIDSESATYSQQHLGQASASDILPFENPIQSNLINPFAADLSLLH
jgi:hypothetical protein